MKCDQVRDRLDRYPTSALSTDQSREIEEHVAECPACRTDHEAASAVGSRLAQLQREIQPPSDLWTGIAPRLTPYRRRIDLPLWRMAAAAALLMTLSSAATWLLVRAPTDRAAVTFQSLEADYARAAFELTQVYVSAQAAMTPSTKAVLERNLAVIERALGEARAALRSDPTNSAIEAIVATAYRRKIEFLERATTLDRET